MTSLYRTSQSIAGHVGLPRLPWTQVDIIRKKGGGSAHTRVVELCLIGFTQPGLGRIDPSEKYIFLHYFTFKTYRPSRDCNQEGSPYDAVITMFNIKNVEHGGERFHLSFPISLFFSHSIILFSVNQKLILQRDSSP